MLRGLRKDMKNIYPVKVSLQAKVMCRSHHYKGFSTVINTFHDNSLKLSVLVTLLLPFTTFEANVLHFIWFLIKIWGVNLLLNDCSAKFLDFLVKKLWNVSYQKNAIPDISGMIMVMMIIFSSSSYDEFLSVSTW